MNDLLTKAPLSANARILMDCLHLYNSPGKAGVILDDDLPMAVHELLLFADRTNKPDMTDKLLHMVQLL